MKKTTIILFLFFLLAFPAHAQEADSKPVQQLLSISPIIINAKLVPGNSSLYEIKIKNLLPQPLGIRTNLEKFVGADEESLSTNAEDLSLPVWSAISPSEFIVDSNETKTINLKITPPKTLKKGGYYEVVFLTPFFSKPQDTSSPTILSRIGILVLGSYGEPSYQELLTKTKIESFNFDNIVNSNTQIDTVFKVSNSYFSHFSAKPFLTISPLFGEERIYQLTDKTVLPGTARKWNETINLSSHSFFNKAKLSVSVGNGNYIYKDSFFFVIPAVKYIPYLLPIILIFLIVIGRKRLTKAIRLIIKGK